MLLTSPKLHAVKEFSYVLPFSHLQVRPLKTVPEAQRAWVLHHKVRDSLPLASRKFLLPKGENYFQSLIASDDGVLLGAFAGHKMVGVVAVVKHVDLASAGHAGSVGAPNTEFFAHKYKSGHVGVVQAFCVLPHRIARGAAGALLSAAENYTRKKNYAYLFAQMAQANDKSFSCFKKNGYHLVARWDDADNPRQLVARPVQHCIQTPWHLRPALAS